MHPFLLLLLAAPLQNTVGAPATTARALAPRLEDGSLGDDPMRVLFGRDASASDKEMRDRCLTSAGAGLAGALIGATLAAAPVYVVGVLDNKDENGELIGEPKLAVRQVFIPSFAAAGAFLGGALAALGTYALIEPDDRPGVIR